MKKKWIALLFISMFSCSKEAPISEKIKTHFTDDEQKILTVAKKIMTDCYFATVISVDKKGQPRARVMEPFAPDKNFVICLGTNPKSRKVQQIRNNNKVTLHYYDKANFGYVSLMGNAFIVDDEATKSAKFKEGWDKFYKNKTTDYLLIKFVPQSLELISFPNNYSGDERTWMPHRVELRE